MTEYERLARLTTLPESDPLFARLIVRMCEVLALRYRPLLWRQGAGRD